MVLLACLAACGGESSDRPDDSTATTAPVHVELVGHTFVSDRVTGHDLVEGSTVTVSFEDDAMRIAAGCNTLFGPYDDDGGELRWQDEPRRTLMACDPALEVQDDWLVALFTKGVHMGNDGADLVLSADPVRLDLSRQDDQSAPDFSARLNGPDTAQPGTVVILSLSNLGRLRDSYQLTVSPDGNGIVEPRHLTIAPGRTTKLHVKVKHTPLTVEVESVGGGPDLDEFTIK
jgi:heat shock protein HslJ